MCRLVFVVVALFGMVPTGLSADELKLKQLATGSIADVTLQKQVPAHGVIRSAAELEKLCKAWMIEAPRVDFQENLVVVGTWKGSNFMAAASLNNGDLKLTFAGTKDLRPGFRYLLLACPRGGVKTVGGQALAD